MLDRGTEDYSTIVTKLITVEKLLKSVVSNSQTESDGQLLRLYNAYLLVSTYHQNGDVNRIIRYLD